MTSTHPQSEILAKVTAFVFLAAAVCISLMAQSGTNTSNGTEAPRCEVLPGPSLTYTLSSADGVLELSPGDGSTSEQGTTKLTLGGRTFMETEVKNERDGLHTRVAFGEPRHELALVVGDAVRGFVDGRPLAPATRSSSTFTFADGSPLPDWRVPADVAVPVRGLIAAAEVDEATCARRGGGPPPVPTCPAASQCAEALVSCLATAVPICIPVGLGPRKTCGAIGAVIEMMACSLTYVGCLEAVPEVGGACCDASNASSCCDGTYCLPGAGGTTGRCGYALPGHCSTACIQKSMTGCEVDGDCCPSDTMPLRCLNTGAPGGSTSSTSTNCCRLPDAGDPCTTDADCAGSAASVCLTTSNQCIFPSTSESNYVGDVCTGQIQAMGTIVPTQSSSCFRQCPWFECVQPNGTALTIGSCAGRTDCGTQTSINLGADAGGVLACTLANINLSGSASVDQGPTGPLFGTLCSSGTDCCQGLYCIQAHVPASAPPGSKACACLGYTESCDPNMNPGVPDSTFDCCPGLTCQADSPSGGVTTHSCKTGAGTCN